MKLVYTKSRGARVKGGRVGQEVKVGDKITLTGHSGGATERLKMVITGVQRPHKPSSTGRVHLELESKQPWGAMSYFPSVIGAAWTEREDQQ